MHTKITKLVLIALTCTGILAAFPEPFDMHCTIGHMVEEKLAEMQRRGSENPEDVIQSIKDQVANLSKETSNDVDVGNSQDHR